MPDGTLPWVSNPVAQDILTYVQIAYPIVLICIYIITFTIRSITTARNDDHENLEPEQLGPGGKPLPQKSKKKEPAIPNDFDFSRPRKLLFEWLSLGVLGSIGGNIAVVIVHAIVGREEHWWCGQSPTVGAQESRRNANDVLTGADLSSRLLHGLRPPSDHDDRFEALTDIGASRDMDSSIIDGNHPIGRLIRTLFERASRAPSG